MAKTNNFDSDNYFNEDFVIAEFNDNSDSYNKERIPWAKLRSFKKITNKKNQ